VGEPLRYYLVAPPKNPDHERLVVVGQTAGAGRHRTHLARRPAVPNHAASEMAERAPPHCPPQTQGPPRVAFSFLRIAGRTPVHSPCRHPSVCPARPRRPS
jgi:hypothetical protein